MSDLVPVSRFRPIVERWLLTFDSPEDAYQGLAAALNMHPDTWRFRLSDGSKHSKGVTTRGWFTHEALDALDVDEFLTAAGLAYLWHTDLADVLPDLPPVKLRKVRKRTVPKRLGEKALRQMHLLHERRFISIRQIAIALYEQYGYPHEKHMTSEISRGWKVLGLKAHGRIEMTVRASTINGLSPRDWQERKRRRLDAGLTQKGKERQPTCKHTKQQAPQKGRPCHRPSLHGNDFCQSHDPERAAAREASLAKMRERQPDRPMVAWSEVHAQLWPWLALHKHPKSRLAEASGVPQGTCARLLNGKSERITVALAGRLLSVLSSELRDAA